jgi:hypothetical protein
MCLTAPGIGRNHRWTVSIRTQTNSFQNNEPETSYMLPVVTAITPSQGITNGGTEITITGHHFGAVDVDSNPGVAVYFSDFSTAMLGCKTYEVRRGRNNPTQPNPSVSNNNETITFLLPEYHTAGHPIKVAIGAGACPPEACADCPSLLRYESQLTDDSTLSYKPPKISLIQIRSFPNATTVKTGDTTLTDKLLILEGENFCAFEELLGCDCIHYYKSIKNTDDSRRFAYARGTTDSLSRIFLGSTDPSYNLLYILLRKTEFL